MFLLTKTNFMYNVQHINTRVTNYINKSQLLKSFKKSTDHKIIVLRDHINGWYM